MRFESTLILVGGGQVDNDQLISICRSGWPMVAADGGANRLQQLGLVPDAIIGDLDSVSELDYWRDRTQILHIAEQDSTDFEKCLKHTAAPFYVAIGFSGHRLDHSLAVIHAITLNISHKSIVLVSESDVCWAASGKTSLCLPVGTRMSIYPLTQIEFSRSAGLQYSLDGLLMRQGLAIGCSNKTVAESVEIVPRDAGVYLIIVPVSQLARVLEARSTVASTA